MATVKFLLKHPDSESASLILFVWRDMNERLVLSIKDSIIPSLWDSSKQRPVIIKGRSDLAELRYRINNIAMFAETKARQLKNENLYSIEALKESISAYISNISNPNDDTFKNYVYNVYCRNLKPDNVSLSKSIATYLDAKFPGIRFSEFTSQTTKKLMEYMISDNFRQNSTRVYWMGVERIYKRASVDLGFAPNEKFLASMKRKPSFEKAHRVVLSIDELKQLYYHQYNDQLTRDVVDTFIVMAFTGIRSKDAKGSSPINFDGGEFYMKDTSKTGARVVIPQHSLVKEIIARHNGFKFPKIATARFLQILHEAANVAGVNTPHSFTITNGGVKETIVKPKYMFITFHTARRSFATNLHKAGIPAKVAMMFTGHKTIQQYMDYIMIDQQEIAQLYTTHSFFLG